MAKMMVLGGLEGLKEIKRGFLGVKGRYPPKGPKKA